RERPTTRNGVMWPSLVERPPYRTTLSAHCLSTGRRLRSRRRMSSGEGGPMGTPVMFIHGLWLHATSWEPWMELFTNEGYEPSAPGWPGEPETVAQARANPDSVADHGIDDVVDHYAKIISTMSTKPILIGHSFGGMIAQKLLGQDLAAAAIAIDAAQIK